MPPPRPPARHQPQPSLQSQLQLFDQLGLALAVCDEGGQVLWVNAALDELSGARRWVGQSLVDAAAQPLLQETLQRAAQSALPTLARALRTSLAGAEGLLHDVRVAPYRLGSGERVLLVELQPLRLREAGADAAFGRMVAHEVRNPLGAIAGAAQLLARAALGEAQQRLVTLIREETSRIDALVEQLQSGPTEGGRQSINIHRVLEHVRQLAEAEFGGALKLVRDYDPSIPTLQIDYPRLVQALLNLLRNAAQAGACRVVLRSRIEYRQRLVGQVHRQVLRVEVEDDGPGLPAALGDRILLPGVSGRAEGSGLGLAVVAAVAREHGGELGYDSVPGQTRFRLRLPLPEERSTIHAGQS